MDRTHVRPVVRGNRPGGIEREEAPRAAIPIRLQELADSLTARDLERCGQKWITAFTSVLHAECRTPSNANSIVCTSASSTISTNS